MEYAPQYRDYEYILIGDLHSGSSSRARFQVHVVLRIGSPRQSSCQTGAEHFQQCAEFAVFCNRGLGPLAVTVLPVPLTSRPAATACAAVQSSGSHLKD
jgi:hypothetical protein